MSLLTEYMVRKIEPEMLADGFLRISFLSLSLYLSLEGITLMWWRYRVNSMWTAFCKRSTYLNWIISLSNFSLVWNFMCPHLTSPQINICACVCGYVCERVYDCKKHEESSLVTYLFFLTCFYKLFFSIFFTRSLSLTLAVVLPLPLFLTLSLARLTLFLHSFVVVDIAHLHRSN